MGLAPPPPPPKLLPASAHLMKVTPADAKYWPGCATVGLSSVLQGRGSTRGGGHMKQLSGAAQLKRG